MEFPLIDQIQYIELLDCIGLSDYQTYKGQLKPLWQIWCMWAEQLLAEVTDEQHLNLIKCGHNDAEEDDEKSLGQPESHPTSEN